MKPPVNVLKLASSEIKTGAELPLPGMLRTTTRSQTSEVDPLLAGLIVDRVYTLAATTRGAANEIAGETATLAQPELLAVEADDGTTLFIRSDALAEAVARLQPEAVSTEGEVDFTHFARFDDPRARSRGIATLLWKTATVLRLPADAVLDEAQALALEWAKEKLGAAVEAKAYDWGSVIGAKALMWKIESSLAGQPGLYRWTDKRLASGDYCPPGDPRLADAAQGMLVLIHGTGSYTVGSFSDLRDDEPTWLALKQRFPGGIFGFEHRTFSESPTENALALLEALPAGAKVSLLTHSRGGLVGDLLAMGQVADRAIDDYRIDTRDADDAAGLARVGAEERARLRRIRELLLADHIVVQRYVRVASPARGTRFLSDNLDAALSDFLGVLQWGGGALVGVAASALGGPVAGEAFGKGASSCLGVVKRLALEIAGRRIDPRLIPGIAAMRVDSPLAAFLADADTHRRDGVAMAVIAGDTEFDGLGLSNLRRRIASAFCDWRLFDGHDNDLVVDTDSMYAGLGFRAGARYLYDQDASVTHFRYFGNATTRDALRAWLADDAESLARLPHFLPLAGSAKTSWRDRQALQTQRGAATGPRPVVILIPDFMACHLKRPDRPQRADAGQRIWLDSASLSAGKLIDLAKGDADADAILADDLFEIFYGDLADHLSATHVVIRCPYDWRQSPEKCAEQLEAAIASAARDYPGQPISLLAHGVGGLVARSLMARHLPAWQSVVDSGGRLLLLGTPNRGTHHIVHTLLGKTDALRLPARLDSVHELQDFVELFAAFPGALALLPRPDFADAGSPECIASAAYYLAATWTELAAANADRWYGDGIGAAPQEKLLARSAAFWRDCLASNDIADPQSVAYVFGQSDKTPCGVQRSADGRIELLYTADGDGMVSWASGRLDNLDADTRCWLMPVEHADLTCAPEYFPALVELLASGHSDKLARLPRRHGEAAATFVLDCTPPVLAGIDELARAALGSAPRRRKTRAAGATLRVSARAGDLRFLDQPVLCGHYIGDPISGAEAALDEMLGGALSERERLGVYAAEIGSCAIIVRPPNYAEGARGSRLGAVVVGLGKFTGQLSARQVSETVRSGVLRFLLQLRDALKVRQHDEVQLYSLLIGWNSTASISVAESVAAITRGVLEANHQFSDALSKTQQSGATVSQLCFIELYRNAAISSAHAVLDLPENLAGELKRMGARIEPAATLTVGEGTMDRLNVEGDLGHWARLIVTDADASEDAAPNAERRASTAALAPIAASSDTPASRYYPERLKYVFLAQRARAETVVQQRQPGLIEAIIREQRRNPAYDARLGQTLFQLMVPLDYKAVAREQSRLLLVLDGYTANLPWELLQNEGEPLVLKMPMIRQLTTLRYRPTVRTANANSACLIVAPRTAGFDRCFPGELAQLPDLPAAAREGQAISESLRRAGWNERDIVISPPEREALDVFATLFDRPYRLLAISAHGIFEAIGRDGRAYSGVVLSDGLLLTAVEIDLMDVVPEVVFLSCCHLASIDNPHNQPNKLAYSLSRTLIEMGVRCVVAAGWAVNDEAACTFASTFFDELAAGENFGDAIFRARKATFQQHPGSNTWGAYQAYGDPGYRLQTSSSAVASKKGKRFVAVDELLATIAGQRIKNQRQRQAAQAPLDLAAQQQWLARQVARCPSEWAARPDVLQAIGEFYADYAGMAFEAARAAYQRAVQLEDSSGRVALRAIEQLANIEARQGRELALKDEIDAGLMRVDGAIRRLAALVEAVHGDTPGQPANPERAALLGSAHKLKAAILMQKGEAWTVVAPILQQAARAYADGAVGGASPYNMLNALALSWLAGDLAQNRTAAAASARQCAAQALQRFAASKDFWDALTGIDGEIIAWLLGSPPGDSGAALSDPKTVAVLFQKHYEEALRALPATASAWDSVVKQWRLLADFIELSPRRKAAHFAAVLRALADHFDPQTSARPRPAPAPAVKPGAGRARQAAAGKSGRPAKRRAAKKAG